MTCILIAGAIASGKTSVAALLARSRSAELVRVREVLRMIAGTSSAGRRTLQATGAALDRETDGRWLADYLSDRATTVSELVVDSVRTKRQCDRIFELVPGSFLVFLNAFPETRESRYTAASATDPLKASSSFQDAMAHDTEREVHLLRPVADLVIDTDELTIADVVDRIAKHLPQAD